MKKFIRSVALILTAVFSAVAMASCTAEQEHSWGEWLAVEGHEPTCTEDGFESRICSDCGEQQYRYVEEFGHNWSQWAVVEGHEPSCVEDGLEIRICFNCRQLDERTVENFGGEHDWSDYIHNEDGTPDALDDDTHTRTCNHEGCHETETKPCSFIVDIKPCCTIHTCMYCGYSYIRITDLYAPHSYTGEWKYCGDWYSGFDGRPMRAHGRECDYGCGWAIAEACEYESVTFPPNGENAGYTLYTCKVCGHSYTEYLK